jgi:hypothetical protein
MQTTTPNASSWSLTQKMAFRFAFIYFILFMVLLDFYNTPFTWAIFYFGRLEDFLDVIIPRMGKSIFNIQYPITSPTIGDHSDSTYIYILYSFMISVGTMGAIVWGILDRKRPNYDQLYYWLTVIVRHFVAFLLFAFALEKFFKTQFPDLSYYQLTQTVGDMTPMAFAYTFFGYSFGYNVFMGLAEAAALLLLFRRTTPFGALLTVGAMANVVAVNINYDIHAKMYASMILVMALFLLLPNISRIARFFFTGQAVALPMMQRPVFAKRWKNMALSIIKWLVIIFLLLTTLEWYLGVPERKHNKLATQIRGVYDVTTFVINSDTLPQGDPQRWEQVVLDGGWTAIRLQGDSTAFADYKAEHSAIWIYGDATELAFDKKKIVNELGKGVSMDSVLLARNLKLPFQFETIDSIHIRFKGILNGDSIFVESTRRPIDIQNFRLMRTGINTITEVPRIY